MPPEPAASYCADAFDMTSICLIFAEDVDLSRSTISACCIYVGLPFNKIKMLLLPFRLMVLLSSWTEIPGNCFNTSKALEPCALMLFSTLNTNLPGFCSSTGCVFSPITTTFSNICDSSSKTITGRSRSSPTFITAER